MVTNYHFCPAGGSVIGAGKHATVLISTFTNGYPIPTISCSDNSYIANLTISNFYREVAIAQACIGTHWANGSTNGYTNFVGENLALFGASDTWYNRGSNYNASGLLVNCDLYGDWDIVTSFATTGGGTVTNTLELQDCRLYLIKRNEQWFGGSAIFQIGDAGPTTYLTVNNCLLVNSNAPGLIGWYLGTMQSFDKTSVVFRNCTFEAQSGNEGWARFSSTGLHKLLVLENCHNLSPLELSVDGLDPITVSYGTNYASMFSFGGDDIRGLGPTLTSGAGAPTNAEPAGSVYMRSDGDTNTTLYLRVGTTWTPK